MRLAERVVNCEPFTVVSITKGTYGYKKNVETSLMQKPGSHLKLIVKHKLHAETIQYHINGE